MSTADTEPTPEGVEPDPQDFIDANAKAKSEYGRFNLAVIGKSGVGKSSLVNAVFGRDVAEVGVGLPVSKGVSYYSDDSLGIWDVEGFELGSRSTPAELMREHLAEIAKRSPDERVDMIWYCVTPGVPRLERAEIDAINALAESGLPVILVVTQVDWHVHPITRERTPGPKGAKFRDWLDDPVTKEGEPLSVAFEERVLTSSLGENGKGSGHGLSELVDVTLKYAPEGSKAAFRIAQRLNLPLKREMARKTVGTAAAAAAITAATPLPVSGAVALAPIQLGMMGRIAAVYDLELTSMMSAGALAQLGVQFTGQAAARELLKLIPVAGNVINGGVASALTLAIGEAWMRLCEGVHTGKVDLDKIDILKDFLPGHFDVIRALVEQKFGKK